MPINDTDIDICWAVKTPIMVQPGSLWHCCAFHRLHCHIKRLVSGTSAGQSRSSF